MTLSQASGCVGGEHAPKWGNCERPDGGVHWRNAGQDPEKMLEEDLMRFKDIAEGRVGSGTRQ